MTSFVQDSRGTAPVLAPTAPINNGHYAFQNGNKRAQSACNTHKISFATLPCTTLQPHLALCPRSLSGTVSPNSDKDSLYPDCCVYQVLGIQSQKEAMSFPNLYVHRKVAESNAQPCDICYKLSSSVLITDSEGVKVCYQFRNSSLFSPPSYVTD